jgi:UDP-N-acetylmuramoyl-L-alanyl-D-glutamate--2,6-diaminopimelate ligase
MALKSSLQKKLPTVFSAYHFLWAWLGARRHRNPSEKIFVIGITGTKGKTTTVELLNAILETAGKRTAILSSLRMKIATESQKNPTGNSMPGRSAIQKFLRGARRARCGYALIEVTSQGVVQHRHRFINWNMGVLTNLHPEHIESHGSYENYRAAKLDFLKYVLKKGGKVFLNRDDKEFGFFADELTATAAEGEKPIEYSRTDEKLGENIARAERMRDRADTGGGGEASASSAPQFLLRNFNQENIAVAVAIAKELGIPDKTIEEALANFAGVPGRMEFVTEGPYTAIVDYAHTPESLEAAYQAAREQLIAGDEEANTPGGRLICVLGAAGGGRDTWKRPEFGKVAAHYCDEIILTDEDSYDESPQAIIDEIGTGIAAVPHPRPEFSVVLDRREALARAINGMDEGDIVIATGKGSEDWIHLARGRKMAWNEKAIVQELLVGKKAARGR